MRVVGAPIVRFMARVEIDESGCWLWTGAKSEDGYAKFTVDRSHRVKAHRWGYEFHVGAIPGGFTLDHICRVRHCVNPDHLEAVTHRENCLRGFGVAGINARKTHCKRGHPFDAENTRWCGPDNRWRDCRTCRADNDKRAKARAA